VTGDVVAEIVKGVVALLLAIVGGGIGWSEVKKHGAETEKRKQREKELSRVTEATERHRGPLATDSEYLGRLRRAQERLARLRDRKAKR
jgi:hypothetical protein